MKLRLKSSDCAMRKHDAWHFCSAYHWSVFVSQIGPQLFGWGGWVLKHSGIWLLLMSKFLLAHCIPSAKWGLLCVWCVRDCLWRGPGPSFVLVLLVPLSRALSVREWRGGGGGVTLLDCSTNTTGWCMKKREQWEGSDPTGDQRARPTGALHHLHGLYGTGRGESMVGRKRRRKMGGRYK